MEMRVSSSESMAEAKTATEPDTTPIVNFRMVKMVATLLATTVAFFAGDICVKNIFLSFLMVRWEIHPTFGSVPS